MKPLHLGNLLVPDDGVPESVIDDALSEDFGVVESRSCGVTDFCFPLLVERLQSAGYAPVARNHYADVSFTWVSQSAKWHTDPGFGMVAGWLVFNDGQTCSNFPELITKHGAVEMRQGDVVVFNSNYGHAWLSNHACVLAMVTVKKRRAS